MKITTALTLLISTITQCQDYDYELIIIGAGAAGLTALQEAQKYNKKIAIIEKNKIGGNKILKGDIPSKTFVRISKLARDIKHFGQFGLKTNNIPQSINQAYIFEHINSVIDKILQINTHNIKDYKNTNILYGSPSFLNNHTIVLNKSIITSKYFIIATGSRPHTPNIKGITKTQYITSDTFFDYQLLPQSMIIIGAGPLGTEMADSLNNLGVKVTLIMKHGLILPTFDFELITMKMNDMRTNGINVQCNMHTQNIYQEGKTISVESIDYKGKQHIFTAENLFIALGREPNTEGLGLEAANIQYTNNGIIVNAHMQTTSPNIYACGDIVKNTDLLSRIAYYQAKIAIHNIFNRLQNKKISTDYTHVSKTIYSTPPLACAGLTEQSARKKYGNSIFIYRIPYNSIDKAHIDGTIKGMGKFICDKNNILIGAHIYGSQAGELLDMVEIGKLFDTSNNYYLPKLKTSPSYFDIIQKAQEQSHKEFFQEKLKQNSHKSIYNWLPGWFINKINLFFCRKKIKYPPSRKIDKI